MIPVEAPTSINQIASSASTSTTSSTLNSNHTEYCVIIIGMYKQPLYEKILHSALKFEHHIQYHDLVYLTFDVDGEQLVIELNDPGTEHTGAREMAIRKADAVILCYSAHNSESFHKLANIVDDFKSRKNGHFPPVFLICNEDEILNEESDDENKSNNNACDSASISEGYGSSGSPEITEERPGRVSTPIDGGQGRRRRPSMDQIREAHDDNCLITREQGENLAKLLGPDCEFLQISYSQYNEAAQLMNTLIAKIKTSLKQERSGGVRDRSRTRSHRHSPLISLRHTQSLKKFLVQANDARKKRMSARFNHSSSDEDEEVEVAEMNGHSISTQENPSKKCSSNFVGNAFRAIKASSHASSRGRSKSQKPSLNIGQNGTISDDPVSPFTSPPLTVVSPPTGEPLTEPFSFEPEVLAIVHQQTSPSHNGDVHPNDEVHKNPIDSDDPLTQKRLSQLSVSSTKSSKNGKSQHHSSTTCVIS